MLKTGPFKSIVSCSIANYYTINIGSVYSQVTWAVRWDYS